MEHIIFQYGCTYIIKNLFVGMFASVASSILSVLILLCFHVLDRFVFFF
jgi:hypothetical protein